ncbi:MAG: TRAP transporter large permease [Gammaproteobacteria bacterium]|jgi:tripartite ATP-independent transporter DctM subunit
MTVALTALLVLLALLGLPLFVALAGGGLLATFNAGLDPALLAVELDRLASSPYLSSIPLFTLAGVILSSGGAPQRMIQLFNACVGWLPGGTAGVVIASCAFFTAFSGASGVTILALGGLMFPMLMHSGYKEHFNLGLLTTSGSLGLLFAPSLAILLYGIVAGVSIDRMFLAGIVPGLLLMVILAVYSMYVGRTTDVPRHKFSWINLFRAVQEGIWDILLPVGIVIGIFGGFVTITEASACTAVYVLLLEGIIHREIHLFRHMPEILRDTAVLVGSILIILSVAMGLTNLLIDAQVPMKILAWMQSHVETQLGFLMLLNAFLLVVGCMMDIFSATVVVVPLILPIAQQYGVNPIHLGIIFLANLEIGYSTPPVGINLFIASQRFGRPILSLFRAAIPFLFLMLIWLILITYIPFFTLWWIA